MTMAVVILVLVGLVMWGMYEDLTLLLAEQQQERVEVGAGEPGEAFPTFASGGLAAPLTSLPSAAGADTPYDWAADA